MSTDFQEEFNRIWGGSGGCTVSGWDWNQPRPFDGTDPNSCYANEAALMSSLTSEAYNQFGFEIDYYVKQISTKRDRLLGEDPLENIVRRFRLSVYADKIPNLQKKYQLQGMLYEEVFEVQATIAHFNEASQYDYDRTAIKYEMYKPKIGDLMYFKFNDKYYEIINVKSFGENTAFLGTPITYTFTLRIWKNNHEDVDIMNQNDDDMPIEKFTSLAETFDIENKTSEVESHADILSVNDFVDNKDTVDPYTEEHPKQKKPRKPRKKKEKKVEEAPKEPVEEKIIQKAQPQTDLFVYEPKDEPAEIVNQKRETDPFDPFDGW
jgi:hypothetical protein